MCTVLNDCSVVLFLTVAVSIVTLCVQFLLLVVLYGTGLQ